MTLLFHLLSIPVGYVYAVALEWAVHRYIFHEVGKRFRPLGFHWHQHHRATTLHRGADPSYGGSVLTWSAHGREFWGVALGALIHLPVLWFAPGAYLAAILSGLNYTRLHRKAHLDPQWCREHLPWHWDHHMGRNPDANWCVTSDWFDRLMGTRVPGPASPRVERERNHGPGDAPRLSA